MLALGRKHMQEPEGGHIDGVPGESGGTLKVLAIVGLPSAGVPCVPKAVS